MTLVPHKSLMHYDGIKSFFTIFLTFPICDRKGFGKFFSFDEVTNFIEYLPNEVIDFMISLHNFGTS